jgi:beta-glucanase (GH16 family)
MLVIRAARETLTGADGIRREYTSARLKTSGRFAQTYGRFEARIRVPRGQGIWPAFWMLGADIETVGWPACGEIDVMENIGRESALVHGTIHGPGYSGGQAIGRSFALPGGASFADDFHVFGVDWEPRAIRWSVDGVLYQTRTPADLPSGARWVFDHPFFLLLNVAVGGAWPGNPDSSTAFPQEMQVDWVRVYQQRTD